MIVTQKKRVPWSWVVVMAIPFFANNYVEMCSGAPLIFTIKKFIDNPALIAFLLSINIAFNFLIAPFVAYHSDRIWTRFGRRKPFVVVGWLGVVCSLIALPLAPNAWTLVLIIVLYQLFEDVAFTGPWQPLYYEVVPPSQRGRGSAINHAMQGLMGLIMNFGLIAQFDKIYNLPGEVGALAGRPITVTGELVLYWLGAAVVFAALVLIMLGIKETPVQNVVVRERFSIIRFVRNMFGDRQWLLIYMLIFGQIGLNAGLALIEPLMITEQFGYTKKMFGHVSGYSDIFLLVVCLPIIGFLADRVDRLKLFQIGLFLNVVRHVSYWSFIKFVAEDQIPSPQAVQFFFFLNPLVRVFGNVCMGPLLFDHIPRNSMGTVHAGMSFVRGIVRIVINWGVGVWLFVYSYMFLEKGVYDYSSGLLYLAAVGIFGLWASLYFGRMKKQGKIIEYGRIEVESDAPEPVKTATGAGATS